MTSHPDLPGPSRPRNSCAAARPSPAISESQVIAESGRATGARCISRAVGVAQPVGALSQRQAEPEPSLAAGKMNSPSSRQATARMTSKTRLKARLPAGKESGHAVRHRDTREFESDCERTHGQAVGARSRRQAEPEPRQAAGGLSERPPIELLSTHRRPLTHRVRSPNSVPNKVHRSRSRLPDVRRPADQQKDGKGARRLERPSAPRCEPGLWVAGQTPPHWPVWRPT